MMVRQAFRYELDPNNRQRTLLAKHAGVARYAYNWGLAERKRVLERGEGSTSAITQHRVWNAYKRENAPWWAEVSKCAPQEALRDLDKGMRVFSNSRRKGNRRVGFPKYKCKGVNDSFRLTGSITVGSSCVKLPRLGMIRTKEPTTKLVASGARITSATLRRQADRWFVSFAVEMERPDPGPPEGEVLGIDRGLTALRSARTGRSLKAPRPWPREPASSGV